MKKSANSVPFQNGHIPQHTSKATKREIHAALKLIELLYEQGELPKHVYRNICNDYYDKGLDMISEECYTVNTPRLDAV